jgi:formylglycine-generating enzyme required for sulfatase activity
MNKILFTLLLLGFIVQTNAQEIKNVQFTANDKQVEITYSIQNADSKQKFDITLYISQDGGKNYNPALQSVSGDVGTGIAPGYSKLILWKPLQEEGYGKIIGRNICFKVEASYKKTTVTATNETTTSSSFASYTETLSGIAFDMVAVKGGKFTMGSPASEVDRNSNESEHQVTVSDFYMGKYEVSQAQYRAIMGKNESSFKGDDLPVENISWYDAIEFCNALSQKAGLKLYYNIDKTNKDPNNSNSSDNIKWTVSINATANGYRLPTEAEWEYAARAGTTTPFAFGNNITTSQANYDGNYPYNGNAKGEYRQKTVAVNSFKPNDYGLYNMHGNVYEWCWDWYGSYSSSSQTNPMGAQSGSLRVLRGGSWSSSAKYCRSANRYNSHPDNRYHNYGFRLTRTK